MSALDKTLSAHAAVDSRGWNVSVARTVDMSSAETHGWGPGVDVVEIVVVVGHAEMP